MKRNFPIEVENLIAALASKTGKPEEFFRDAFNRYLDKHPDDSIDHPSRDAELDEILEKALGGIDLGE